MMMHFKVHPMLDKSSEFSMILTPKRLRREYFKDLLRYRDLLYFLTWRDILVRYKQAVLGVAWAIFRPLITMIIFSFVFGRVAALPSHDVNYSFFVFVGLLPWLFFSTSVTDSSFCLVNNASLISKVYFPRIIILLSNIMVNLVDFFIGLGMMLMLFLITGTLKTWTICLLPLAIVHVVLLCLGSGLWLSALAVRFRDLRFIIQFMVQFGMFISPIGYGSFMIPNFWKWLFFLNPIAGLIDEFRWIIFGLPDPNLPISLSLSLGVTGILLISGFTYFRKIERSIADII
jgi:lipopolysaccharide transport system permease protein